MVMLVYSCSSVKHVGNDDECLKRIIARLPIWKMMMAVRCCQPVQLLTLHPWLVFGLV